MASSLRLGSEAVALERGPLYYYHGLLSRCLLQYFVEDRYIDLVVIDVRRKPERGASE